MLARSPAFLSPVPVSLVSHQTKSRGAPRHRRHPGGGSPDNLFKISDPHSCNIFSTIKTYICWGSVLIMWNSRVIPVILCVIAEGRHWNVPYFHSPAPARALSTVNISTAGLREEQERERRLQLPQKPARLERAVKTHRQAYSSVSSDLPGKGALLCVHTKRRRQVAAIDGLRS